MNRDDLLAAFDGALDRVDPEAATRDALAVGDEAISVRGQPFAGRGTRPFVVAIGKAAAAMVRGAVSAVGPVDGVAISDHPEPCTVELLVSDHPIPSHRSVEAGRHVLDRVSSLTPEQPVIFCISGGGSALVEVPVDGVTLGDIQAMNRLLIDGGLPIEDINEIRAAVSRLKGGGLARACRSDRQVTLIVSDVVGSPHHVASGPTIGHQLGARAARVIAERGLADDLPPSIVRASGVWEPSSAAPTAHAVVGSSRQAAAGARDVLTARGIDLQLLDEPLIGDVDRAVAVMLDGLPVGGARIAAGEVTVHVTGTGLGGRNQHSALIAASRIAGSDVVFGAFGTDGRDGPTDAAGAIVDGGTVDRLEASGVDVDHAIASFDSHTALRASGDLIITGPTGTNVADVWIAGRR